MKRNIKDILSIDLKFLLENSRFLLNENSDENDHKKYLIYDLKFEFLDIFDQMGIDVFHGEPWHLAFRTKINEEEKIKQVIREIVIEHGPDQNDFTDVDWNRKNHFAWWFKNKEHEKTVDDSLNPDSDNIYYGIMINPYTLSGIELVICDYMVLETEENKKLTKAKCGLC